MIMKIKKTIIKNSIKATKGIFINKWRNERVKMIFPNIEPTAASNFN